MDSPASDASVYAMIPFRKLRRSVSTENRGISRDYNADTTPIRIGVSRMRGIHLRRCFLFIGGCFVPHLCQL